MKNVFAFYLLLAALLSACGSEVAEITGCETVGDIRPVCGMKTPEDIAPLNDGRHLLLSNFAGMQGGSGSISLFDTQTETLRYLFPPQASDNFTITQQWGESDCQPPPFESFSPHGTFLHQLSDGRWRYLVVNHGARESIEMFELIPAAAASELHWRGCVMAPAETFMNDVVGLSNGDVIFSRMFHNLDGLEPLLGLLGFSTGDLWRWSREDGAVVLPGTEAAQPNGLEISADERFVFANMYSEKEVWKVDAVSGEKVASAAVAHADNSAWGSDGRLWIATHSGGISEMLSCLDSQEKPCGAAFEIIALDPETMATEVVFSHRGPPMGVATIAVPQAGRVYMGSFVGERLISVADFADKP